VEIKRDVTPEILRRGVITRAQARAVALRDGDWIFPGYSRT
jgi:hypothetical protein